MRVVNPLIKSLIPHFIHYAMSPLVTTNAIWNTMRVNKASTETSFAKSMEGMANPHEEMKQIDASSMMGHIQLINVPSVLLSCHIEGSVLVPADGRLWSQIDLAE